MPKLPDNYRFVVKRGTGFNDFLSFVVLERRNKIGYWVTVDGLSIESSKLDREWINKFKRRLVDLNLMYGISYDYAE